MDLQTRIPVSWDDGTEENLYLDFSDINDGTVKVFSDKNSNGIQRQKTIGFSGVSDNTGDTIPVAYLQVIQLSDDSIVASFDNNISIYDNNKASFKLK